MFNEILDGLLLGDGCLIKRNLNARYSHSCKHKEYLEWLQRYFEDNGISVTPKIYQKNEGRGIYYQIQSRVNPILTTQYERWYLNKKKTVPQDIELTPLSVLHWYIGDGGLDSDKGYLRQISLAAHSFSYNERQILVDKLNRLGFKASNRKNGLICIAKSSISSFLNWIGASPVESYNYKWDINKYQSKQPKY